MVKLERILHFATTVVTDPTDTRVCFIGLQQQLSPMSTFFQKPATSSRAKEIHWHCRQKPTLISLMDNL